jgi:hypothetical protein
LADQVDLVKDGTIAFLSTSGLLLTLILALIAPHVTQGPMSTDLGLAALLLIGTSFFASIVLAALVHSPKKLSSGARIFFYLEVVLFFFALIWLVEAINAIMPSFP